MICPDCGKDLIRETGSYRCEDCPMIVPFEELFNILANALTGRELEDIINNIVDIGYDVEYVEDGAFGKQGYFKKIYREEDDGY